MSFLYSSKTTLLLLIAFHSMRTIKIKVGILAKVKCFFYMLKDDQACLLFYLTTRAPPPFITFSTSVTVTMEVSPGVVIAKAPWAAP